MRAHITTESFRPNLLSRHEMEILTERLYGIHSQIFDGIDKDKFREYVVESKADLTKITLFKDEDREVGYTALHFFEGYKMGRVTVVRAECGLLPDYRRKNLIFKPILIDIMIYFILNPGRRIYYFGSFVHPAMYLTITRYLRRYYPSIRKRVPGSKLDLIMNLATEFHLRSPDAQLPLSRKVGWITRQTERDKIYWENSKKSEVRTYLKLNPTYSEGNGLLILIPVNLENILYSCCKFFSRRFFKWVRTLSTQRRVVDHFKV